MYRRYSRIGRPSRSNSNKSLVVFEIGVHSSVAVFERHPQFVGHCTVHLQLLGILAERGLADDWIPLVGFLEYPAGESPVGPLVQQRRTHIRLSEVSRVPERFCSQYPRRSTRQSRFKVTFRFAEMILEQLDECSGRFPVALFRWIDEQRCDRLVGRS